MIEGFQKQNARISKDTEIRVHINICSPVRMHVCISPSSKDMVIRACARNIIHVHTRIYMHTCTHACKHAYIHAYMSTCIHTCIRMKFVFPGSPTQGHHSIQAHLRLTGQFLISLKGHRMLCAQRLHPQKLRGHVQCLQESLKHGIGLERSWEHQEQENHQLTRQRLLYGIGLERGLKHQGQQRQRRAGLSRMCGIGLERVHNYHGQEKEQCTAL